MAVVLLTFVAAAGCSSVRLIAEYDKRIDDDITSLQKKTETFLSRMERNAGTPEGSFERNAAFYDDVKADIAVLIVRSEALGMNQLTTRQLVLLKESILSLEEQHKKGLTAALIGPVRQSLNTHYAAVLRLEVAKKKNDR